MKLLRSCSLALLGYIVFFCGSSNIASCGKEIIHDTVIVRDTITIVDSIFDTDDCMVAYYNFVGGNLKDSSGNGNHITFSNATPTADRFGNANGAYLFNGTSSYMTVPNHSTLNPTRITLMAVVKLNGFYAGQCHGNQIFKKGFRDQIDGIYGLRIMDIGSECTAPVDTSKEYVYGYYGNTQFNSIGAADMTTSVRTNKWMTVVFTYDGHEAKIYVDGVLKNTTIGSPPFTPNTDGLFIGRAENPQFPYWFNGVIDEIRIYNKALNAHEVHAFASLKY